MSDTCWPFWSARTVGGVTLTTRTSLHLTLLEAALRGRRARLAQALAAERSARRPTSLLSRWLFRRAGAMQASG